MSLLQRTLHHLTRLLPEPRPAGRPSRSRWRPRLEQLEARQLLATMNIGMNIERVTDYSADWMFTDAFKESRPWLPAIYNTATGTQTPDTTGVMPLSLDANGWPTQLNQTTNAQGQVLQQRLGTLMFDGQNGHYPAGTYTAWWDGTGTVQWGGDVTVAQTGVTPAGHHFALLSDPTPGNRGIQMQIAAMSSTDPIHDIHVWMPDYNGQSFVGQVWQPGANFSPFHPLFLQRLTPFDTLRFMQDSEIITSQVQHWSDRRPWSYETQMSGTGFQNGLAPEYLIELCNELNENLWINVPHMADDAYVQNLANQVQSTLKPNLKVYLEWSNEVWNRAPGFVPHQWVMQQLALPQNAGVTFEQFVAREDRRVFDLWSPIFSGQPGRLVRVVAGFEENPGYTARVLQNMNGDFDAVTSAAYFGPDPTTLAGYSESTTVDQVISDTTASIAEFVQFLQQHKALADQYATSLGRPIQYVAYEGGPALEGHNQPYEAALNAASVDPRMYGIYSTFLNAASNAGLALLTNYEYTDRNLSNTPFGIYGALNYQDQPVADAPKYRALVDFIGTPNTPPTISAIPDRTTNVNTPTAAIAFTVGDAQTPAANLLVSGTSSNAALVPGANMVFGGSGANRTLTITPAANQTGTATISVTVTDGNGATASAHFMLTVVAPNMPPVVTAAAGQTANQGMGMLFNLGSFTDAATDSPWAVDVNWGDPSPHTQFNTTAPGALGMQPHTYAAAGTYTVTVNVTDRDGATGQATFLVAVNAAVLDVSSQVRVVRGRFHYNPTTHRIEQMVMLTNVSSSALAGPVSLVLDHLRRGVRLVNRSGVTRVLPPLNSPYVDVLAGNLAPGASVRVVLEFIGLRPPFITYTTRVLAGSGMR
jgi:hypothetical protein